MMQNFSTLTQLLDFADLSYQNPNAFNFLQNKNWVNISTKEFSNNVRALALGLKEIGVEKNDGFGIASYQSPIWMMVDFSAIASGAVTVPIFPNIAPQNLIFQIKDASVQFIFCDSLESLQILQNSGCNFKKIIIHNFKYSGENIISFDDLLDLGKRIYQQNPNSYLELTEKITENDLATIIYTSGSTGTPKGVEITHKNLVSQIKDTKEFFPLDSKTDIALSFLPLAHIFERMVALFYISEGISIYFADDVKNVGNLMREIRPTLMTAVPRVLEKVYSKMKSNVDEANFFKKFIGNYAFKAAKNGVGKKIFDILVYKKLRTAMGGRLKMIICGGAALNLELEKFYQNIGINLYVGYGLTETSPVIATNCPKAHKTGTVGKKFPSVEVKLSSDGELLAKGPNIMRGYHNNPQKTAEVIDKDGWLATGDMAQIDADGFIKIIGRKKELFKTANGKYVSPVPIEQALLAGWQLLSAALIIAENRKFVSCLLFVEFEILEKYKKKIGLENLSDDDFLNSDFIKNRCQKLITDVNKKLNHWEQIQKFSLITKPISINTGDLTPSMKLRRNFVEEKFKNTIEEFYQE